MIAKKAELDEVILLMKERASEMGVTIFMPHVAEIDKRKINENAKWCSLANRTEEMFVLTPELYEILSYRLDNPLDQATLKYVYGKNLLAVLWSTTMRTSMIKVLKDFIQSISDPQPMEDDEGNQIPNEFKPPLLESLYVDSNGEVIEMEMKGNGEENSNDEERRSTKGEGKSRETRRESRRETQKVVQDDRIQIPPVWTPGMFVIPSKIYIFLMGKRT